MYGYPTDAEWIADRVEQLPEKWQRRLTKNWAAQNTISHFAANSTLRLITDSLGAVRIPLDASEGTVCDAAKTLSETCWSRAALYSDASSLRGAMERIARAQGIKPPAPETKDGPAIARMTCPMWWRRKLRAHHGRKVEGAAIMLGYVNKHREIYVSNESVKRRAGQEARNTAMLEATLATNELGNEYTLAELAAKGPSNRAIKRAELMTRIGGFERIARAMGHIGLFVTVTCPSRMHKWRTVANGARCIDNPKYDNTQPGEANKYLGQVWARVRAALARLGARVYGFRIAEPQHDGTPHWHMLVFMEQQHGPIFKAQIKKYALADNGDEQGAHARRVDIKAIDWDRPDGRGSAAGYIAKYVAKNIDGYGMEKDLFGNDMITTAQRVETWARTFGIRQFQQIGGAPVGPWRELRRIKTLPEHAPDHLVAAHRAVNKMTKIEGRENATIAWDAYTIAQGGVFCGRDYLIKVTMALDMTANRYGEDGAKKPVGVNTMGAKKETYAPTWAAAGMIADRTVWTDCYVESTRYTWTISRAVRQSEPVFVRPKAEPWTRVTNCTDGVNSENLEPEFSGFDAQTGRFRSVLEESWKENGTN